MIYWVEQKSDWDDEGKLWELVMMFEFESDAEAWIRRKVKTELVSIKSFRIFNLATNEIKYLE